MNKISSAFFLTLFLIGLAPVASSANSFFDDFNTAQYIQNLSNAVVESGVVRPTGIIGGEINPSDPLLGQGLLGLWHFNGNVSDSVGSYHGVLVDQATCTVPGLYGQGCTFDGAGDAINLGDIPGADNTSALSMSLWVKPRLLSGHYSGANDVLSKERSGFGVWKLSYSYLEQFNFFALNSQNQFSSVSSNVMNTERWYHLASTFDGVNIKLYVDGVLSQAAALSGILKDTAYAVCVGKEGHNCNNLSAASFNGTVDELALWSRTLSAEEVQAAAQPPTVSGSFESTLIQATEGIGALTIHWVETGSGAQFSVSFDQGVTWVSMTNDQTVNNYGAAQSFKYRVNFNGITELQSVHFQWSTDPIPICGNNVVDMGEVCDGSSLNGMSCQTQGFLGGLLTCDSSCQAVNTSTCNNYACGNGVIDPGESCDQGGNNSSSGDGCSEVCHVEVGWWCSGNPSVCRQGLWQPPVGVPTPSFGLNEQAPPSPNPWTMSTAGFYYVKNNASNCSDSTNGTPQQPRCTIPDGVPPGSVIEMHGRYGYAPQGYDSINNNGTSTSPIFIRGKSPAERPYIYVPLAVFNSSYVILENLEFGDDDGDLNSGSTGKLYINSPAHHLSIRWNDIHGNFLAGGGGVALASYTQDEINDVVIYNNLIHGNGDWQIDGDQDVHGITINRRVRNAWVVDNQMYQNSGDGIQINAESPALMPYTHHIYVGRNVAWQNKQTGFALKFAVDLIFSQNVSHNHRPSGSTPPGPCMGWQYGPERVWYLYNTMYDCESGIASGSVSGPGGDGQGQNIYIIGNKISNIHQLTPLPPNEWQLGAALFLTDEYATKHIYNNTIFNVDKGIYKPRGSTSGLQVGNNIMSNVRDEHIIVTTGTLTLHNGIFDSPSRVRLGSSSILVSACSLAVGLCLETNPLFMNPFAGDFRLQSSSPAIDSAVPVSVYDLFETLYPDARSIRVDADELPRPQGAGWDFGAHEFVPPADQTPPTITGIAVTGVSYNMATIQVLTNEPTRVFIRFGTTTAYGRTTTLDSLSTTHFQDLTGLSSNTLYHYQVVATDAAGNETVSADRTFRTSRNRKINNGFPPID